MSATARKSEPRPLLPADAQAKFVRLKGEATDARDAAQSASKRMNELRPSLSYFGKAPENLPGIEIEMARLHSVFKAQDRRHRELSALTSSIETWLLSLPRHTVLEPARVKAVAKLQNGETLSDAILRIREEIADAQQLAGAIRYAPSPKTDLKVKAKEYVDGLAARGRPIVTATPEGGLNVAFGDGSSFVKGGGQSAVAITAWLHGDALLAGLCKIIDKMPDSPHSLPAADRAARLAEIRASLDGLERQEEALIEKALAQGTEVLRRPEATAYAVLGVVVSTKAA